MPTALRYGIAFGLTKFLRRMPDAVDAELVGRHVHQPLDRERHLRPAGRTIGVGRHGVGEHRARAQGRRRNVVAAGDQAGALRQRRQRHAARAGVADVVGAHRQDAAALVERQLDLGDEIAALVVGEERLRARRGVFDRALELARRPQHQAELDERPVARAEVAADVIGQDAQLVGRDAEHAGPARSSAAPRRRSRHRACICRSPRRTRRGRSAAPSARR